MLRYFIDLVCPPHCSVCEKPLHDDTWVGTFRELFPWSPLPPCEECSRELTVPMDSSCPRCGAVRREFYSEGNRCKHCRSSRFLFQKAIALGKYEGTLRRLVLEMKTQRSGFLAGSLAALLVWQRKKLFLDAQIDLIVPVPIHSGRRRRRGGNSPDFIATEIGRSLGVPVWKNYLFRVRETELQYLLFARRRLENVKDAFASRQKMIGAKHVLLVDDILTTGSTCNEIAKLLKQQGALSVTACVLARSEGLY